MKRVFITSLLCCLLLTSCGMKGDIYLTNLQKLYPDAGIEIIGDAYHLVYSDLTLVYSADIDMTIDPADVTPEHTVFKGTLADENSYSFDFVNNEFSNHKTRLTVNTDGETRDIYVSEAVADTTAKTLTHGIPDGEVVFVTDKDLSLIGVYKEGENA